MKKILLLAFLCYSFTLSAQEIDTTTLVSVKTFKKISPSLQKKEKEIKALFDQIIETDTKDSTRIAVNLLIKQKVAEALKDSDSFFYPFDSLRYLGKIYSDDYNIRIYTWCCEMEDMSYTYYGFIHDYINDLVYPLVVKNKPYIPQTNRQVMLNNWYGALYYKAILTNPKKRDPKYILLGWNQSDLKTKQKIIDVLTIEEDGADVRLGSKILKGYGGKVNRIILSYCADLGISLNYYKKDKRFVFDHLTPLSDDDDKPRGCAGPDMSYDALKSKRKGKRWVLVKDVDVKNEF